MKNIVLITLSLLMCLPFSGKAQPKKYYFSSVSGNDVRTTVQAQNPATPWASITKLNSFWASLAAGDSVLFKRGETFYAGPRGIIVGKSGTLALPIIVGAFGTGAKPVISGFQTLTGWTSIGGGLYETNNAGLGDTVNMVTINGVNTAMGRTPNANATLRGYSIFEAHTANTSITDNQLTTTPVWTGAELVVRDSRYVMNRTRITNHTGTVLTYAPALFAAPLNGFGYFIQDDTRTLDQLGEWKFTGTGTTRRMTMFFGAANPTAFTIKATAVDTLVHMYNLDNLVFRDLAFEGGNMKGFNFYSVDIGVTKVINCDVRFIGQDGMFLSNGINMEVTGSTFRDCHWHGIFVSGGNSNKILNDTVNRIAMLQGHMGTVNTNTGIRVSSDNCLVRGNVIDSTGYIGLRYGGNNDTLRNNFVRHFCMNLDDGGGIYTSNQANNPFSGNKVVSNVVVDGGAPLEGTGSSAGSTTGIYLDDNTNGLTVDSNVVANINLNGIYMHNNYNVNVRQNLMYNATAQQFLVLHNAGQNIVRNIVATGNIQFSQTATQYVQQLRTDNTDPDIKVWGTFNNSWHLRPISNGLNYRTVIDAVGTDRNIAAWRTYSLYDVNTIQSPRTITSVSQLRFEYNATPTVRSVVLSGNYVDAKDAAYSGTITLAPFTGLVLIQTAGLTTPTITWNNPAAITYGTALSGTQLNATVNAPGTLAYTPAAGTVLNAGTQTLSVTFTPTDPTVWASATKTVTLVVNKATATLAFSNLTRVYTGSPLSPTVTTTPAGLATVDILYNGVAAIPTAAGTYTVTAGLTNNNFQATAITGTFTITKAPVTLTISNLAATYDGTQKPVTVTASPNVGTITVTYDGSPTPSIAAGSHDIVATLTNPNYQATPATATLVIAKATPTVTWPTPAAITYGTAISGTQLNATFSVAGTAVYTPVSGTIPNAGTVALSVTFTPTDAANYNSVSAQVNLVVNKATATLTLGALLQTYNGSGHAVTVTTSPAGLATVTVLYNGSATLPVNAGSVPVTATLTSANYTAAPVSGTLVIDKATATLLLSGLTQVYDGTARIVNVVTSPAGLGTVTLLYDGSATPSVNAGNHAITATLNNANYQAATATGTLVVSKATPNITWNNPAGIVFNTPLSSTQLNAVADVPGTFTYSPAAGTILPTGSHILSVNFTPTDAANYNVVNGTSVTIVVSKATAVINLSGLSQFYDGTPKPVTVSTTPAGLDVLTILYNGSPTPPTTVGTYPISVSLTNDNWQATTVTGNLVISASPAAVTITNFNQTYTGSPLNVTVTVTGGYSYSLTYNGSATAPTSAGSYTATATINDGLHTGTATVTFVIAKATPDITWSNPAAITYGTLLSGTQLNATTPTPGVFTYTPAAGTLLNVGPQLLSVSFAPTDAANYTPASATVDLVVNKATATLTLGNLTQAYDGTPKSVSVVSSPVGLAEITVLYNGSPTPPTAIGSYAVTAHLDNANYTATDATGTLQITTTTGEIVLGNLLQVYNGATHTVSVTTNPAGLSYTLTFNGSGSLPINAGTYTVVGTLNDGIHVGSDTKTLVIQKATPVITWPNPAAIAFGTSLGSTQLNASTPVAGSMVYTPAAGTVLNAGTYNLSMTFTPTDAANYNAVTTTVPISVTGGTATLSLSGLAQAYNGLPHPVVASVSPSTSGVTVTYNGSTTPPTDAGSYAVVVTLVSNNYTATPVTGTLVITRASAVLSWTRPADMAFGTPLGAAQLNATSSIPGTFTYSYVAGTILNPGTYGVVATFTPTDTVNYNITTITVPITVIGTPFPNFWIEHGGTWFENLIKF